MNLKLNFATLSITALLLISIAVNIYLYQQKKGMIEQEHVVFEDLDQSEDRPVFFFTRSLMKDTAMEITRDVANQMAYKYLLNGRRLKDPDGNTLQGLRIDKPSIDSIFASDASLTDLYLMFGIHPNTLDSSEAKQSFTIALMGISPDGTDVGHIDSGAMIFDYLDPCPDRCPNNHPVVTPSP